VGGVANATELLICTDENMWYPFTYAEGGISRGMHVEIIQEACKRLAWKVSFEPLPWKRCLASVRFGTYDAVVSASYKPDRAKYLYYPPDAETDKVSPWRITQAEYVVLTHISTDYEFDGDVMGLPQPIQAPIGYSIVSDLTQKGLKVETSNNSISNIKLLMLIKKGCVIASGTAAKIIAEASGHTDEIKIHPKPLASKSYFIVISEKSKLNETERDTLWQHVVQVRQDKAFFKQLVLKYQ